MSEPIKCLDGFHVYREQDYPDERKSKLYLPLYSAITHLWRSQDQIAVMVPLGEMDSGSAQRKAHQWANRHGFSVDSKTDKTVIWFRRSQKPRDNNPGQPK